MQNVLCTFSSPSCPPQSPRKSRDSYPWRPRNYAENVNKSPVLTKIALTIPYNRYAAVSRWSTS